MLNFVFLSEHFFLCSKRNQPCFLDHVAILFYDQVCAVTSAAYCVDKNFRVCREKGGLVQAPLLLLGEPYVTEDLLGLKLRISPLAFFQVPN